MKSRVSTLRGARSEAIPTVPRSVAPPGSSFALNLPVPPSTNNLFFNAGKRRVRTPQYAAWVTDAGWAVLQQKPKPVEGRFEVWISVPRNNRRDLDNYAKACLDLLVAHSLVRDDRFMERLSVFWHDKGDDLAHILVASA